MAAGLFRGSRPRSKGKVNINLGFGEPVLRDFVMRSVDLPNHNRAKTHTVVVNLKPGCLCLKQEKEKLVPLNSGASFAPGEWPVLYIHRSQFEIDVDCNDVNTADGVLPQACAKMNFRLSDSESFVHAFEGKPTVCLEDIRKKIEHLVKAEIRKAAENASGRHLHTSQRVSDTLQDELATQLPERLGAPWLELRPPFLVEWTHDGLKGVALEGDGWEVEKVRRAGELRHILAIDQMDAAAMKDIAGVMSDVQIEIMRIEERIVAEGRELAALGETHRRELNSQSPAEDAHLGADRLDVFVAVIADDDSKFAEYLRKAKGRADNEDYDSVGNLIRKGLEAELRSLADECKSRFNDRFLDELGRVTGAPSEVVLHLKSLTRVGNQGSHHGPALKVWHAMSALWQACSVGVWLRTDGRDKIRELSAEDKQKIREQCNPRGQNRSAARPENNSG